MVAWLIAGLLVAAVVSWGYQRNSSQNSARPGFDADDFARLPALVDGRLKPMDTIARSSLLIIHGKQRLKIDGRKNSAIWWLVEMLYDVRALSAAIEDEDEAP